MNRRSVQYLPVLIAAVVACAAEARAADSEGPVLLGRRERGPLLTLDPFSGSVELDAIASSTSNSTGGTKTSGTDLTLREMLNIGTGGAVVSPAFMSWHGTVGVGMVEDWTSGATNTQSTNLVETFNLGANLLSATQFPLGAYANRSQSYISQSFASMLQQTRTEYGATAAYRSAVLPTTLRVSHAETEQSSLNGDLKYSITEDHVDLNSRWRPNPQHEVTLNYQYTKIDNGGLAEFGTNYSVNDLGLTHDWLIDNDGRYRLSQAFHYTEGQGSVAYQQISLDEDLQMQHTDEFNTFLQYGLNQQTDSAGGDILTNRLGAGFTHRLFQSLVTTGSSNIAFTTNSQGGSDRNWSNFLGTTYTKKVPLGVFTANLSGGITMDETTGAQSPIQFFNQKETFDGIRPIILPQQNIDPTSVRVYDATRTHLLQAGKDYRQEVVNHQVRLTWLPGGLVGPTDQVATDYVVLPTPDTNTLTTNFSTGARYQFQEGWLKGLGVFGRLYEQTQTVDCAIPDFIVPDDVTDISIGADYDIWKLRFSAEQQWHQSTLNPYDMTRFSARYTDKLGDRARLTLIAQQAYTQYEVDRSDITAFNGRFTYDISQYLKASYNLTWRNENNTSYGKTMGFEHDAELLWDIRQTHIFLRVRQTMLSTDETDNSSLFFQFGLQRRF